MFEYSITTSEGEFYTLITAGDPSEQFPNAISITTVGEYNPSTTQNAWVLA